MSSKYVDTTAIVQVLGTVYNNVGILENEAYFFDENDFVEDFHKILFGSIYNLHALGVYEISPQTIEDYLSKKPKSFGVYKANKGAEYLIKLRENIQISAFDYYYNRMKKMTLLRMYDKVGMNVSWIYDPDNIFDNKKKQVQDEWLDNTSLEDIAELIDKKITDIKLKYVDDAAFGAIQAGSGAQDLRDRLKMNPEFGYPMYGDLFNTATRGARLKKVYLRSAPSGVGKTRAMIADVCSFGCGMRYDKTKGEWIDLYSSEPTLYITTEQEMDEIQTMMWAFIADVDEGHILENRYEPGEEERIDKAIDIMSKSPIYIQPLPDFSLQDIENAIKSCIRNAGVKYVVFDYIHTSMKILSEVSSKSGVRGLREDNILFMISVRLKDLANKYGVFIETGTQLNGDYKDAKVYDQNLLRGAKAIADKIDLGMIMLEATAEDMEKLNTVIQRGNYDIPNIKVSIYKNRRGRYKNILFWCKEDRGTCKITPIFATNYQYELLDIEATKIKIRPEMCASAF